MGEQVEKFFIVFRTFINNTESHHNTNPDNRKTNTFIQKDPLWQSNTNKQYMHCTFHKRKTSESA